MAFIGNTPTTQAFTPAVDVFSGNGSTTAFTLSRPVASVAQVQAFIENVPQSPVDAFTVSGNTITFTSAPPSGSSNIYVRYTSPITQVIMPSFGTVGQNQLTQGAPYWDVNGNVGIGTSSPSDKLVVAGNILGGKDGTNGFASLQQGTSTITGFVGFFDAASSRRGYLGYVDSGTNGLNIATDGAYPLRFLTNGAERARIDSSGNLLVGTTSRISNERLIVQNSGSAEAAVFRSDSSGFATLIVRNDGGSGTRNLTQYRVGTTDVGWVSSNGTTAAYNTTSDYRLKENVQPMTGALAKVAALKPCTYTWKADGSDSQGFIAHELQAVVPDCVTGEKDAVDADGNPVYQGIDTSFLVATLTAAIQEQQAIIEQLRADVDALKGAA